MEQIIKELAKRDTANLSTLFPRNSFRNGKELLQILVAEKVVLFTGDGQKKIYRLHSALKEKDYTGWLLWRGDNHRFPVWLEKTLKDFCGVKE